MSIFELPPSSRYADASVYGFYMQEEGEDRPINELVSSGNYVALVLSPQQIVFSEPFATSITFTQGGGKFIESRGQIIKQASVSGTTGYLPQPNSTSNVRIPSAATGANNSLVNTSFTAEQARSDRSGFAAFHELRQLFRRLGNLRRKGKIPRMFYFDTKSDEYWEIEPMNFDLRRSSRKPFSYDYEIRFVCLEVAEDPDFIPYDFSSIISSSMIGVPGVLKSLKSSIGEPKNINGTSFAGTLGEVFKNILSGKPPYADTIRRYSEMAQNGLGFLKFSAGVATGTFQSMLNIIGSVVQVFDDVATTTKAILDVPVSILRQLSDAIVSCFFVISEQNPSDLAREVVLEWNEFLVELQTLNDHMITGFDKFGDSYSNRTAGDLQDFQRTSLNGTTSDLMTETGTPLAVNPFLGATGLEAVTDIGALLSSDGFKSVVILSGETIYDVARRNLGNVHRFVELVLINNLQHPFVVPSSTSKPFGTIAWGEYIKIPIKTDGRSDASVGPPGAPFSAFTGLATATGTATSVISVGADPPWREDQWAGYTLTLTSGLGAPDGVRIIVANSEDTLFLNRAWTVNPSVDDSFNITLQQFSLHIPPSPDAVAYGRDWLLKFSKNPDGSTNPYKASVVRDSTGAIATVAGQENFNQAMYLVFSTPQGEHPFHSRYGFPLPVGRPFTSDLAPLYTFYGRQSLLQDPRVATIKNPQLLFENGCFKFQLDVQPINAHKSKQLALGDK